MKLERNGPVLASLLSACIAVVGCGDGAMTGGSMRVPPMPDVTVCQGFSHGISLTLPCAPGEGNALHFCHFVISTSDSSILQILDNLFDVAENTTLRTGALATIGGNTGFVSIFVDEFPLNTRDVVGIAQVVPQSCVL